MSTASKSKAPKPGEPDPFRYGWRYVPITAADGTEDFDQIPLTLEDVLFPETGDFIVHTDGHNNDVGYLKAVFMSRMADEPTAAVISDCRVDWNLPGVRPLGPDVAVFLGLKAYKDWATLDVAKEQARPVIVVEVTSPDTRRNDVKRKVSYYHRAKVPVYLIADVSERRKRRHINLIAYEYAPERYAKIEADTDGRIRLPMLGLSVGLGQDTRTGFDRVACFDLKTGEEIGDYIALNAARIEAEARAKQAKREATVAKRKARAQTKRADAEQARADAEQARADAEARTRADLEARVRHLEARLAARSVNGSGNGKPAS